MKDIVQVSVKIDKVVVNIDEAAFVGKMLAEMLGGKKTVFHGRINGRPVLFTESEDDYRERRCHVNIVADTPDGIEKFRCLATLYRILTGQDYCALRSAEKSFAFCWRDLTGIAITV